MSKTETIVIENVGAIKRLEIPVDPKGGVTVLHGRNGCGKDTGLGAVSRGLGGKQTVERSDGADKGTLEGFGVRLTIGKSTRSKGLCQALSLTGTLDLAEFVDPPVKDPAAADRTRIKALLALRGVQADAGLFHDLGAGEAVAQILAAPAVRLATDLVDQARQVKAAMQEAARVAEEEAAAMGGKAEACREAAEGLDLEAESDREKLQAEWEAAFANQNVLTERRNAADDGAEAVVTAETALEKAKAGYEGPTHDEAKRTAHTVAKALAAQEGRVAGIRVELEAAEKAVRDTDAKWHQAAQTANLAEHHENLIADWQATIDADRPEPVTNDDMNAAIQAVATTADAIDQGVRIRDARQKAEEADTHAAEAQLARESAEHFRKAAAGTDAVLSKAVASPTIYVNDGRVYVAHDKREKCLFAALSKGEAWRVGILEAVARVRDLDAEGMALIPIPQHAWEGLDDAARALVVRTAREKRVNIITADCRAGGELRAEVEVQ